MKVIKQMQREGISDADVLKELTVASNDDQHFDSGRIMYSMCNEPTNLAATAHAMFLESNLGDPNLYRGTARMETAVLNMLLTLLHGSALPSMGGSVVSGGSEANITALWMCRNLSNKRAVVLPVTAHYSFATAADMLDMTLKYVDVDDQYRAIPKEIESAIDDDTALVVATAGTTEVGQIDPISVIQRTCVDRGVPLHVDAAFGGLVFPFLANVGHIVPEFDFNLDGVTSMTVDPHKMGQATAPAGALLVRDPDWFDLIKQDTFYLSADSLHSILGTRCSAGVASAYAMMRHLGVSGYDRLLQTCMRKTSSLVRLLKKMGFHLAIDPISPVVCVKLDEEALARRVQRRLADEGWLVSRTRHPHGVRVVMMPHIQEDTITAFAAALNNARNAS